VTMGHVTPSSHVTSGHVQWYILNYYYSNQKARGKWRHFLWPSLQSHDFWSGDQGCCVVLQVVYHIFGGHFCYIFKDLFTFYSLIVRFCYIFSWTFYL
jgi:hypothetical protein